MLSFTFVLFCLALVEQGFSSPLSHRADNATTSLTEADIQSRDLVSIAAFAAAAYCVRVGLWNCGDACEKIPDTQLVFTIGDDAATPDVYVAYSQSRNQIIVGHEGTDPSQILSVENDIHFSPTPLLTVLNVAGTPEGVEVHNGFQTAWVQTSTLVLGAVKQVQAQVPDASVLVTGHSLGAAISLLDAIFLKQQLPSNTSIQVVGFGRPRVGNPAFANWVDSMFGANNTFVVSRDDPVPHVPLLAQGFQHASGEVWIKDNTTTLACDGQENPNCSDSIGVLDATTGISDHLGPYFGVNMGHASCANLAITTVVSGTRTLTTIAAEVTTPFSTSLSLRVTSTPSNIPIDTKNGVRGGIEMHAGAAMGAVVFSALVGAVVLF
ncbi:alpha/beta-hydrolase [Mycena alexandri]|uniref:Alpha/beta-hydrolase n=1 Tax=Mycena alexandri TaxID=1745969 RepID=A0AAD6S6Z4_9AGAR|nr:alpha/beta-hydrolase [Mycena alexandri]